MYPTEDFLNEEIQYFDEKTLHPGDKFICSEIEGLWFEKLDPNDVYFYKITHIFSSQINELFNQFKDECQFSRPIFYADINKKKWGFKICMRKKGVQSIKGEIYDGA